MFPEFNKNLIFDDSAGFFGMEEVPPYEELGISGSDNHGFLSDAIRGTIAEDSSGYIEQHQINCHFMYNKQFTADFNKEYIFMYFKGEEFDGTLPYCVLLKFLQHKVMKLLLVLEDIYFYFEKTPETYDICVELEKIYSNIDFFYNNVMSKKQNSRTLDECYLNLISEYINKSGKKNYKFIDDLDILIKLLKLKVE